MKRKHTFIRFWLIVQLFKLNFAKIHPLLQISVFSLNANFSRNCWKRNI